MFSFSARRLSRAEPPPATLPRSTCPQCACRGSNARPLRRERAPPPGLPRGPGRAGGCRWSRVRREPTSGQHYRREQPRPAPTRPAPAAAAHVTTSRWFAPSAKRGFMPPRKRSAARSRVLSVARGRRSSGRRAGRRGIACVQALHLHPRRTDRGGPAWRTSRSFARGAGRGCMPTGRRSAGRWLAGIVAPRRWRGGPNAGRKGIACVRARTHTEARRPVAARRGVHPGGSRDRCETRDRTPPRTKRAGKSPVRVRHQESRRRPKLPPGTKRPQPIEIDEDEDRLCEGVDQPPPGPRGRISATSPWLARALLHGGRWPPRTRWTGRSSVLITAPTTAPLQLVAQRRPPVIVVGKEEHRVHDGVAAAAGRSGLHARGLRAVRDADVRRRGPDRRGGDLSRLPDTQRGAAALGEGGARPDGRSWREYGLGKRIQRPEIHVGGGLPGSAESGQGGAGGAPPRPAAPPGLSFHKFSGRRIGRLRRLRPARAPLSPESIPTRISGLSIGLPSRTPRRLRPSGRVTTFSEAGGTTLRVWQSGQVTSPPTWSSAAYIRVSHSSQTTGT